MKRIFTESKKLSWAENAVVGGRFITEYTYAIGYWEAGNHLIEKAKELSSSGDRLFYPICFTYRQSIELVLKKLIILAQKFYKKSEDIGYEIKKLTRFRSSKELTDTHSLEKLLTWLIKVLRCVSDEVFDKDIRSLILEFHNFDPNGQRSRYSVDKDGNPSFPTQQSYNLTKMKMEIARIIDYLAGIDAWIDYHDGMANDIMETYNPS